MLSQPAAAPPPVPVLTCEYTVVVAGTGLSDAPATGCVIVRYDFPGRYWW